MGKILCCRKKKMKVEKEFGLDRLFVRRLIRFLGLLFPSVCSNSTWLLLFVFILSVLDQVIAYFVGILASEFYVVLGHHDDRGFRYLALKSVCIIAAKAIALASIKYSGYRLYLLWRRLADLKLHSLYFQNFAFYELNVLDTNHIDNPDQRITQDVEKATRLLATEILAPLILSPFVIGYYTYKTYAGSGYLGPLAIYSYFVLGTLLNRWLLSPIVDLVVQQERKEGDFRFKHVSVRSNAEAIGFYHSGDLENILTNLKLFQLLAVQYKLIKRQSILALSTGFFDYFGGILSYFIIAIPIFLWNSYDHIDPVELTGIVSRNAFFYMYLVNSFSKLIDLSNKLGDLAGTTHRVMELLEQLAQIQDKPAVESLSRVISGSVSSMSNPNYGSLEESHPEVPIYALESVTYSMPGSNSGPLVKDLYLSIHAGVNLLITGDSSTGKSSLLRVLAALWKPDTGFVERNSSRDPSQILFLPQKPYFPDRGCSLRQQIVYPLRANRKEDPVQDEKMERILKMIRLEHLINRCVDFTKPTDFDWQEILSPGELQRLALARIFYHHPRVVFLDEATSALGFQMESQIYQDIQNEGITCVSVGHRLSLKRYHMLELHLEGGGIWSLGEINHSSLQSLVSTNL